MRDPGDVYTLSCGREMRIRVWPSDFAFIAVDDQTYDGAPDAGYIARLYGMGPTAEAARADLIEWHEDAGR